MKRAALTHPFFLQSSTTAVSFLLRGLRLSSTAVSTVPAVHHGDSPPDPSYPSTSVQTPVRESSPDQSVSDVFRRWGCSDAEVSIILKRRPSLARNKLALLDAKLRFLHGLRFLGRDLVRIVVCRPAILAYSKEKLFGDLVPRLDFLRTIFNSDDGVHAAIIRNPSLLTCELGTMRRCVDLYESVGIKRVQLGAILRGRPTTISRSKLDDQKLDFIHRTGVTTDSKLYKYIVCIVAVSKLETLQEKIANLQKFGFSVDEVLKLFGRSPYLMTLSVEKVQRNMTYIVGTLKLDAQFLLKAPELLYINLDRVLRPRFLVISKMQEMGLEPRRKATLKSVMRMTEEVFLKKFVMCQDEQHVVVLMEFYNDVIRVRRLADKSRKMNRRGFPY